MGATLDIIKDLLKDYQPRHSAFQIDNFIIGSQCDDWAKYKQALREIYSRQESLIELKEKLELDFLNSKKPFFKRFAFGKRSKKIREIEDRRRRRSRAALVAEISECERELERFVGIASKLKRQFPDLDEGKRHALESQSWLNLARRLALVDSIVNVGRPSINTVEFVLKLPENLQQIFLSEMNKNGMQIGIKKDNRKSIDRRSGASENDV